MKKMTWNDIDAIAEGLHHHKIYAFPTDTVYGVGVKYGDLRDLEALKKAKHRPEEKPIPMMVSSIEQIEKVAHLNAAHKKLIQAFMPGAFTLILPLKEEVDRTFTNGNDTIAIRMPDSKELLNLIDRVGSPLMVSSANISGEKAALTFEEAAQHLPHIEGIVDGVCQKMEASTIVDGTNEAFSIVRSGPISKQAIDKVLEKEE